MQPAANVTKIMARINRVIVVLTVIRSSIWNRIGINSCAGAAPSKYIVNISILTIELTFLYDKSLRHVGLEPTTR